MNSAKEPLFLIITIVVAIILIKKQSNGDAVNTNISEDQQRRLVEILKKDSNRSKQ